MEGLAKELEKCHMNVRHCEQALLDAKIAVDTQRDVICEYICEQHPTVWIYYATFRGKPKTRMPGLFLTKADVENEYEGMKFYRSSRADQLTDPIFEERSSALFTLEEFVPYLPGLSDLFKRR